MQQTSFIEVYFPNKKQRSIAQRPIIFASLDVLFHRNLMWKICGEIFELRRGVSRKNSRAGFVPTKSYLPVVSRVSLNSDRKFQRGAPYISCAIRFLFRQCYLSKQLSKQAILMPLRCMNDNYMLTFSNY
jgi:hypothetical protein